MIEFVFNMGQLGPLCHLFSFSSPSGIKLGSNGPESAALSTRPPPRPQLKHIPKNQYLQHFWSDLLAGDAHCCKRTENSSKLD